MLAKILIIFVIFILLLAGLVFLFRGFMGYDDGLYGIAGAVSIYASMRLLIDVFGYPGPTASASV